MMRPKPMGMNRNPGADQTVFRRKKSGPMITLGMSKLKPGMILAEPVHNFQGVLLLDTGAKLTEKSIRILKSWGVIKVCVVGKADVKNIRSAGARDHARSKIETELRRKFGDVPENPVVSEIMRVAGNLLERRALMKEEQHEG